MSKATMKVVAGVAALAAIAFGASAIAGASGSGSNSAGPGGPFAGGRMQQGAPGQGGTRGGPGFGRPVTGATADKVKAAVLAKYPGTIEGVVAVPGRGYLAHVLRSGSSEVRVLVDSNFKVVGVAQGPPGGPGMQGGGPPGGGLPGGGPPGGAPSGGAPPQPGSTS